LSDTFHAIFHLHEPEKFSEIGFPVQEMWRTQDGAAEQEIMKVQIEEEADQKRMRKRKQNALSG
jgi:hypothetical protein